MRTHSIILIGVLGISGVASADPYGGRIAHVFAKGRGESRTATPVTVGGRTRRETTIGNYPGPTSSFVSKTGKSFHELDAQSTIGNITRTEVSQKKGGVTSTISSVESFGAHPSKVTVKQSSILGGLLGWKSVDVVRGGNSRSKGTLTLFGKPLSW